MQRQVCRVVAPEGRQRGEAVFESPREKETYVRGMFDAIAPRYDLLNRVMAANLDQRWRRLAARTVVAAGAGAYFDVGAGTGDLTFAIDAAAPAGSQVIGLDLAREMMVRGRAKKAFDASRLGFVHASGLRLPAADASLAGITNAFVLRNLADLDDFFEEAFRTLRPGGHLVSLEINRPPGAVFGPLYRFYFFQVMPRLGRVLSGDAEAYSYLADSVKRVEDPPALVARMRKAGFEVALRPLMRGAVVLFDARKP